MKEMDKLLLDVNKLQVIASDILQEAARLGADQAEVAIAADKGFSVTARNGEAETVAYNQDKVIEINLYAGKRSGSASISDVRPEAIRSAVEAAWHIARFTGEDPDAGLALKEELAINYPKLALAFPWNITVEEAIDCAILGEREALSYDKRLVNAEEVSVATSEAITVYANSNGFMGNYPHTRHEMSCVLIAKEGDDMQRDYSYTVALDPSRLLSMSEIAKKAAERTLHRLGARRLKTMKAPVIFIAEEARGLFGHFASAISGSNLYRKSSFLLNHLNEKIFPSFMHIQEFPHLPHGLGSVPFDHDGVATRNNMFVEEGILRSYSLGVYAARKLGMKTTGNSGGMHNLTIQSGSKDLADLLKEMGRGLLVTELMGSGVNLVTGDYSRGAGGFWVENGEIQYPVHEITIASHLKEMYAGIVEVGTDIDIRGGIRTGSVLINEMMIAGS